jgi:leader peptidase (prepilin peptidase)/N-methyltransferase
VDTLLVSGATLAGLVIGAALDPVGQRLADASRAEDDRRRLERQAAASELRATDADAGRDAPSPADGPAAGLVPTGRSRGRQAAAAVVTGALFGAEAAHFGRDLIVAPFCVFFAMLVAVSMTDLSHRLVPRRLVYPAMVAVAALLVATSAVDHRWHSLVGSVIAGAVAFGLFFAIWWFVPRGMGYGDVRLAGAIGFTVGYLSLLHAYVAFLAGFLVGTVFGLIVATASSSGRKTRIPFGPSLAVGAAFAVLWGGTVAHTLFHAGT